MANSLDNLTRIAQASFMQALAESPEQYAQFLKAEHERWTQLIRSAGLKME